MPLVPRPPDAYARARRGALLLHSVGASMCCAGMQLDVMTSQLDQEHRRLDLAEHELNSFRVEPLKDIGDLLDAGCSGAAAAAPTRGPHPPHPPHPRNNNHQTRKHQD